MILSGTVQNGVVVFDPGTTLPDGTRVEIAEVSNLSGESHFELFQDVIGQAVGLPDDMAANHNHYLRGGPKT
jgi:hypothetical protein